MILTYRTIHKVQFPVFLLPSSNWDLLDGLLFVDGDLVDDKNMPGETLGVRRLQSPFQTQLPLKKAAEDHLGVIKSANQNFIDSKGRPFIYEKTLMCPIKYHKIKSVEKKTVASVLRLHGLQSPFTIPRPPKEEFLWAGVLYLRTVPWFLYEYSFDRKKDTRRKI